MHFSLKFLVRKNHMDQNKNTFIVFTFKLITMDLLQIESR